MNLEKSFYDMYLFIYKHKFLSARSMSKLLDFECSHIKFYIHILIEIFIYLLKFMV